LLSSQGGVKCWGRNYAGQLGNGTTKDSSLAVDVLGSNNQPIAGATSISAGNGFACALLGTKNVLCWGRNSQGQLGIGSTAQSSVALTVGGTSTLSSATAIAAGWTHACALIEGGTVKCWGSNSYGDLGDGTTTDSPVPIQVANLSGVTAISAGNEHSCVTVSDATAKCWGGGGSGELGNGLTKSSSSPVAVSSLTGVAAIQIGNYHACAVVNDQVLCWGNNNYGQLGNNTTTNGSSPTAVVGPSFEAASISTGYGQTCAVTKGATVKCWGNNLYGQLGDGTKTNRLTPTDVLLDH